MNRAATAIESLHSPGTPTNSAKSIAPIPRVTIVILNYRTADLTIRCVRSLRELAYPNTEILVIDNCSCDDSMSRLAEELPDIELHSTPANGGYTAGNNFGIRLAQQRASEYVLLLNPDTELANAEFLTDLVQYLEAHPTVAAAGPRVFLHQVGVVQNTILRFPWIWRRIADKFRQLITARILRSGDRELNVEALNGVCVLYRSSALAEVGWLDERIFAYADEIEWSHRALEHGWKLSYVPVDSIVHYPHRDGEERNAIVEFLLKRNTLYFLLKNGRWIQAIAYTTASWLKSLFEIAMSWSSRHKRLAAVGRCQRLVRCSLMLWQRDWERAMGKP